MDNDDTVVSSDDVMRVLVATDNHMGFCEQDAVRGEDSFTAFEEILDMAVRENVDFILLGGDLFHDAVPSQNSLNKCMSLLRRYTFGDKPISVEFLSKETTIFRNAVNESVNYEDPNINISIPVFSIHGNHDDPSGFGRLSSLDLLSTNGLLNYFGRWTDLTKVEIKPLLLRKGATQLALYGLSHIHDARLARLFATHQVTFEQQSPESGEWFHLMTLHQNRNDRGPKNYIPEEVLPNFLNLVVWGHEHDCHKEAEPNDQQEFYVYQPGSSVATSLSEGESIKKHVGLLEIYKTKFKLTPMPLETVRPFVFESVNIASLAGELQLEKGDACSRVQNMARDRVEAMIEKSKTLLTGHPQQPTLPLIRLRLLFTDEDQMFNTIRFGQTYNEQVANPTDMVVFKKLNKPPKGGCKKEGVAFEKATMNDIFVKMETTARVEDLLEQYFEEVKSSQSQILPPKMMSELCFQLVERRDNNAVENMLRSYRKMALDHLLETLPADDAIDVELNVLKERITPDDITKMSGTVSGAESVPTTAAGKRAAAATSAAAAARSATAASKLGAKTKAPEPVEEVKRRYVTVAESAEEEDKSDDEDADNEPLAKVRTVATTRGRGRGRGSGVSAASTSTVATRTSRSSNNTSTAAKPPVPVATNTTRSTRQQSLLTSFVGRGGGAKKQKVYVVTDSDDSD